VARLDISLADLSQDIAGAIPADIVLGWNRGERTREKHDELLHPFRAQGTIAASDSAGLSRLTQRYSLAQVMKLVSEPKEVVHAYGAAIGGEAIGIWAADNSEMFYAASIDPARVVTQMLAVQREVKDLTVQIGLGIHACECYRIAGGLFGPHAELIEEIAEDETAGGETVISDTVLECLPAPMRARARRRQDLADRGSLWSLTDYDGALDAIRGDDRDYPAPFDGAFLARLRTTSLDALATASFDELSHHKTVAFIKVPHREHPLLLDAFTEMSLIDLSIRRVAALYRAEVIKSTGALAIVLFDDVGAAVDFSRDVVETTARLGFDASVGIARGEVFLFPLQGGGRDIAGNAVNLGSKLSEDSGMKGILVEASAPLPQSLLPPASEPFTVTISRVKISGYRIAV
jgi:class 3 adenylate cyclase